MGKGAHNWNRQHVNSNFFSDDPSISQLGAAVEPLFSLRPIFHFHVQHFSTGFPSKSYFIFVSPCPTACVDLPLPFGQFSTSLRPIFHFPSPNLPLSYAQFVTSIFSIFQQDFSSNHISYLFPRPTACAQLATFFCLISLSLATLFF